MSVLEVRDLSIRFGGLQALANVSLEVNEFEIVGLIGPNGAGKTTAFNCITGFYTADTGTVTYRGEDVTKLPPHRKAAMGFGRTFQNVGMVKSATALENLKTAQHVQAGYDAVSGILGSGRSRRQERALTDKAEAILDLLGLSAIRDTQVGGLSYGTLKLLELGCALATDPQILLLDEPTSGMGPEESDELGQRLLTLRKEFGITMLLIEHHVPLVLAVCDHVYVLNFGQLLAEGRPTVIQTHPEVVAAYLGGSAPDALEASVEPDADVAADSDARHHEGSSIPVPHHDGGPATEQLPRVTDDGEAVRVLPAEPVAAPRRAVARSASTSRSTARASAPVRASPVKVPAKASPVKAPAGAAKAAPAKAAAKAAPAAPAKAAAKAVPAKAAAKAAPAAPAKAPAKVAKAAPTRAATTAKAVPARAVAAKAPAKAARATVKAAKATPKATPRARRSTPDEETP